MVRFLLNRCSADKVVIYINFHKGNFVSARLQGMYQSHNFHNQCSYLPLSFKSEPFADHVFQTNHPEAQQPQHQGTISTVLDPYLFFQKCIIKQWCTQTSRPMQICNSYAIQTRSTRVFPFRSIFRQTAFTIEDYLN